MRLILHLMLLISVAVMGVLWDIDQKFSDTAISPFETSRQQQPGSINKNDNGRSVYIKKVTDQTIELEVQGNTIVTDLQGRVVDGKLSNLHQYTSENETKQRHDLPQHSVQESAQPDSKHEEGPSWIGILGNQLGEWIHQGARKGLEWIVASF